MLIQKQKTKEIINNPNNDNATVGLSHDCFNWLEKVANANDK